MERFKDTRARVSRIFMTKCPNDGQGPVAVVKSTTLQRSKGALNSEQKSTFERAFRKIKEGQAPRWVIDINRVYNLGVSDVNEVNENHCLKAPRKICELDHNQQKILQVNRRLQQYARK